ncbi:hypothetical protein J6590_013718 [Homalodisca vitripennis]|nr:hypothetical protein J6590_013718 [Homalodisca vitripennis]
MNECIRPLARAAAAPLVLPRTDVNERKTSLEIVPSAKYKILEEFMISCEALDFNPGAFRKDKLSVEQVNFKKFESGYEKQKKKVRREKLLRSKQGTLVKVLKQDGAEFQDGGSAPDEGLSILAKGEVIVQFRAEIRKTSPPDLMPDFSKFKKVAMAGTALRDPLPEQQPLAQVLRFLV